jgi:ABC-type transport system substrate-binding protein
LRNTKTNDVVALSPEGGDYRLDCQRLEEQRESEKKKERRNSLKKILFISLAAVLILSIGLIGCEGEPTPTEEKITMGFHYPLTWGSLWDPRTSGSGDATGVITSVWEGLLGHDPITGELEPRLATDWSYTSGGTPGTDWWGYYDFTIRENVPFHNGDIMTAEDVKYSIQSVVETDPDLGWYWASVARDRISFNMTGEGEWDVEILPGAGEGGKDVVRVHMAKPWYAFLQHCSTVLVIVPEGYTDWADNPVGTGPFKLNAAESNDVKVRMEAVEDHWRYTPDYDVFEYQILPNADTKYAALAAGIVDITMLGTGPHVGAAEADPSLTVVSYEGNAIGNLLFMDLYDSPDIIGDPLGWGWGAGGRNETPWQDVRVREASVLAINKTAICETMPETYIEPYGGYLVDFQTGYTERTPVPFDQAAAIALLGEVADDLGEPWQATPPYGWEDWDWGTFWSLDTVIDVSTMIVADWAAIGIDMGDIQLIDWGTGLMQWAIGAMRGVTFHHTAQNQGIANPESSLESRCVGMGSVERAFAGFWFPQPGPGGADWPAQPSYYWPLAYADDDVEIATTAEALEDAILDLYGAPPVLLVGGHWAYGERIVDYTPIPGVAEWVYGMEYLEYNHSADPH